MTLSTHVLDTGRGAPAAGIPIALYAVAGNARTLLHEAVTNADGRTDAAPALDLVPGVYELVFAVEAYFARSGTAAFYTDIAVRFTVGVENDRYHVPLLLSPWGYSTYRGS